MSAKIEGVAQGMHTLLATSLARWQDYIGNPDLQCSGSEMVDWFFEHFAPQARRLLDAAKAVEVATLSQTDFCVRLHEDPPLVLVIDNNRPGTRSVTNSAEAVVAYLAMRVSDLARRRIAYRDTDGVWDELVHHGGAFVDFAPIRARTEEGAIADIVRSNREKEKAP
jgi:hypothetical protein